MIQVPAVSRQLVSLPADFKTAYIEVDDASVRALSERHLRGTVFGQTTVIVASPGPIS